MRRFRYIHGDWKQTATSRADPPPTAVYVHPKSYQMGAFWMSEAICFDDVKITNDKTVGPSMVRLGGWRAPGGGRAGAQLVVW